MERKRRYIIKRVRKSRYIALYLYVLFVLLLTTSVASYAWFTMSKNPQVSDMNMYVTAGAGLELSNNPGAAVWTNYLDIYSTEELKQFQGDDQEKPFLRQVSWSEKEGRFYAPLYGYDGRLMHLISWFPLDDAKDANKNTADNYYIKATIYARSGQTTEVKLSEPAPRDSQGTPGAGTYVVGYPDNTGKGPEVAIRIGMRMTYVDSSGDSLSETGPMYIYEPNIDRHADGITEGYVPTYSIHQPENPENGELAELVDSERMITQEFSFPGSPGEFVNNPALFSLDPGEIIKIELYIWLEGQDVDCSNVMSALPDEVDWENLSEDDEAYEYYKNNYRQIRANIQFTGTSEGQSGMIPIPFE